MDPNNPIPPATAEKLITEFPKGTRHKAKIDIAVPLIGNGMSPSAVFAELRSKFPEASDSEIDSVIKWVVKANPTPTGYNQNGNGTYPRPAYNGYRREPEPEKPKKPPKELADWWVSGSRTTPDQMAASSPVTIPESLREQGKLALGSLFRETDLINIVCQYMLDESKGKANPQGSGKTLARDKWLEYFDQNGVPQSQAGAWVRINPCAEIGSGSGGAVTNDDITAFRYLLVESDDLPIPMQLALYQRLTLPVAAVILSGGGSAHAWIKIEAVSRQSYEENSERILKTLERFGIDRANKNCSRLCRLPGAQRTIQAKDGGFQRLVWLNPSVPALTDEVIKNLDGSLEFPAIEEKPLLPLARLAIERYEELWRNKGKLGVPYGVPGLDTVSGGMKPGQTIVVAGVTGGGKSTFGLHLIDAALRAGTGVLLFSLEMDREEIFDLIMSNRCVVNRNKFNNGKFEEIDFAAMKNRLGEVRDLPLYIEDSALSSADQIRLRTLQLKAAKKIGLVVVDYIQFVNPGLTRENREQQIAQISHMLRTLARETKMPMVILSQLNDEGKLRESRVIAHNANVVLLIEIEKRDTRDRDELDRVKIKVIKGRGIPSGEYELDFDRSYARLLSRDRTEDAEFEESVQSFTRRQREPELPAVNNTAPDP